MEDEKGYKRRREPQLNWSQQADGSPEHKQHSYSPEHQFERHQRQSLHPAVWLTIAAVIVTCILLVADRAYTRYQQHRMMQSMVQGLEQFDADISAIAKDNSARARAQQAAREKAQQQRAANLLETRKQSKQGRWLGKNCSDWTRAWEQLKAETARVEMRKHCKIHQSYLKTGIAPR